MPTPEQIPALYDGRATKPASVKITNELVDVVNWLLDNYNSGGSVGGLPPGAYWRETTICTGDGPGTIWTLVSDTNPTP